MINELDKEIDSLLRQAARAGGAFPADENLTSAHITADEISLFAENVLPIAARTRAVEHLADCARCRTILSTFISLNPETKDALTKEGAKNYSVSAASIPWYRKLFAFPNVAYAMGALALLFSGLIVVIILKNTSETQNSSVARMDQVEEIPQGAGGASSDGEASSKEVYPMSNSSAANSNTVAAPSATTMADSSDGTMNKRLASGATANSNASILSKDKSEPEVKSNLTLVAPPPAPTALTQDRLSETVKKENSAAKPMPKSAEETSSDNEVIITQRQQADLPLQQSTADQNQAVISPDSRNINRLPINGRSVTKMEVDRAASSGKDDATKTRAAEPARSVGGKTFKRADGVWYDAAYNQQKPINVRRGTDDYKKLDSGLRSIAENLGGTIVVVWKGRAYRIQ